MPLIEVNQTRRVTANVRFDDAIVVQINQYAAFIKASPDEVINKGLEYLFSKDRDFAAFRANCSLCVIHAPYSHPRVKVLRMNKI